jgi:dynein heavy chain
MEKDNLRPVKIDNAHFGKIVDQSIRLGKIVLIEDIAEDIDPSLDSVLAKAVNVVDGMKVINFQDKDVPYDDKFKLYITTKLPNPHYLPEICIKLTIINFTVTYEGLEEQLLVDVVVQERPEVETQRDELVLNLAKYKEDLTGIQIKILQMLSDANEETILDDTDLI